MSTAARGLTTSALDSAGFAAAPSVKKTDKKHPKNFSVKSPILHRKTGVLRRERRSSDLVHESAVCQWTCYHALHREALETYTESNKHQILAMARGKRSEANTKKKGRKKKKKGSLKTIKEGYHRTKTIVEAKAKKKMQREPSRIEGRVRSRIASQMKSRISTQMKIR